MFGFAGWRVEAKCEKDKTTSKRWLWATRCQLPWREAHSQGLFQSFHTCRRVCVLWDIFRLQLWKKAQIQLMLWLFIFFWIFPLKIDYMTKDLWKHSRMSVRTSYSVRKKSSSHRIRGKKCQFSHHSLQRTEETRFLSSKSSRVTRTKTLNRPPLICHGPLRHFAGSEGIAGLGITFVLRSGRRQISSEEEC